MFRLLIRWRANPWLPAFVTGQEGLRLRYVRRIVGYRMNSYALLAHAVHRDLWFA